MNLAGLRVPLSRQAYAPAEDTLLLARAATPDLHGLNVVETCAGLGIAGIKAATVGARVTLVDVLRPALDAALAVARENSVHVERVVGDALGPIRGADVVLANPPYLPTDEATRGDPALDGGPDGAAVTRRVMRDLPAAMAPAGRAFVVVSTLQPLAELRAMARRLGLLVEVAATNPLGLERLELWRIGRAG